MLAYLQAEICSCSNSHSGEMIRCRPRSISVAMSTEQEVVPLLGATSRAAKIALVVKSTNSSGTIYLYCRN